MKKIIAFIASGVIPTFIPICALLTLPICMAEKYVPKDLQNTFSYGIRFFQLVLAPESGSGLPVAAISKPKSIPVVEATVTSMAVATQQDCYEVPYNAPTITATLMKTADMNYPHAIPSVDEIENSELLDLQNELKNLETLRDRKISVTTEHFQITLNEALKNLDVRLNRVQKLKKRDYKHLHFNKKRTLIPA